MKMKNVILVFAALCFGQAVSNKDYVLLDLGCWLDKSNRAVPSIENMLQGRYQTRSNAIQQCAQAAKLKGYTVFAVQNGGWCASGHDAVETYKKYGASDKCKSDGKGGPWANQVYEIDTVLRVNYRPIGCFKDKAKRAIDPIEGRFVELHGKYTARTEAIKKCARAAAALGDNIFAVQNGGWCASTSTTTTYDIYGRSQDCNLNGKGGALANNVYEITEKTSISLNRLGCFLDKSDRAMPLFESSEVFDVDDYTKRPHAIEACVRYAFGFHHQYVGIQNGGACLAGTTYDRYGHSTACLADSKGGPWANEVFELWIKSHELVASSLPRHEHYYLNNLGCWKDTANRAIATLEGDPILIGEYTSRKDAIQRCAKAAMSRGYRIIAVQNGGYCSSSANARNTYMKYGAFDKCRPDGKGGPWANQVYEVNTIYKPVLTGLGCYRDTGNRAVPQLDDTMPFISDNYKNRTDAINKCGRAAGFFGYEVFAVQDGGWCASSADAKTTYMKYGLANNCGNGRGGAWANSVYKILKNGVFYIADRGCWADDSYRTIPPVEDQGLEYTSDSNYQTREDAIAKCARFAHYRKFKFFALQNGGWCATSADAGSSYKRIGPSQNCAPNGKGGPWSNQVYEILD